LHGLQLKHLKPKNQIKVQQALAWCFENMAIEKLLSEMIAGCNECHECAERVAMEIQPLLCSKHCVTVWGEG